jgi:hypothetical protein
LVGISEMHMMTIDTWVCFFFLLQIVFKNLWFFLKIIFIIFI